MFNYLLAVLLAALVVVAVILQKTYTALPAKELKRRAESGGPVAARFWQAVAYGASLRTLLWVVILFSATLCFVLLARIAPPFLGFIAVALLLYVVFAWLPAGETSDIEARLTFMLTPAVVWLLGYLDPVLLRLYQFVHRRNDGHVHTGVYVREDMIELLEKQKSQTDNQLSIEELNIATSALKFGERKVREITVMRKKVVTVDAAADISPVFLDELHKSTHSRFPVYEGEPNNFVGVLYLSELTGVGSGKGVRGKVKSHMSPGVVYLHQSDTLADALHAFYLTKRQLFIVINKFEEYVGILTLEDVLQALLGEAHDYDFDQHEVRSAVAAKHTKKSKPVDDVIDETAVATTDTPTSAEEVIE